MTSIFLLLFAACLRDIVHVCMSYAVPGFLFHAHALHDSSCSLWHALPHMLQQQAKCVAHMPQCGSKVFAHFALTHSLCMSTVQFCPLHARSLLCGKQSLVERCRRSTDGKWRQQRLGSRLCMTLGWSIFGVGNLLRFAAMRFAAQMVLSGLGSLQFVMIPIVSNFLLGDKYTWEAFVSIVIILGGAKQALSHCCLACLPSGCFKAVQTCCVLFWHRS